MCIIVAKPKDVAFPDRSTLFNCFLNNSDGAGFAVARGTHVEIDKGYFKFPEFYDALMAKTQQKDAVVMHFRISTSGRIDSGCCHPYPICTDYKLMKLTDQNTEMAIAHNGVLSCNPEFPWVNDTMTFVKGILKSPEEYMQVTTGSYDLFEMAISGSKLAVIRGDGEMELHGDGWMREEGIYYSNISHKWSRAYSYNWRGGWEGYDDDDDDDWDTPKKVTKTPSVIPLTRKGDQVPSFTLCEACGEWGYEPEEDCCHYCGRTGPEIDDVVRAVIEGSPCYEITKEDSDNAK